MSMELRRKEDLDFFKHLVEKGFEFNKVIYRLSWPSE